MSNDSDLFRTREELEEREGAYPVGGNRFASPAGDWVPLYVGRMIHQFDHRAASVDVNAENLHNAALSGDIRAEQKADPALRSNASILGARRSGSVFRANSTGQSHSGTLLVRRTPAR